jgi:glycerol-3-phosphate acyltransferase PlsY
MLLLLPIALLLAYLIGSIPSAVWVGKWFYGIDVREHGSGNAGATNVIRVLGYKAGIPVLLFDVFKGWFAVQLAAIILHSAISPDWMVYPRIGLAAAAVIGHIFPVFASFRGGKGVGTLAGVGIALFPLALLIVVGIFIVVLILTKYVSLSSITASVAFPFIVWFVTGERNPGLVILAILVAIFVPLTHIKNIRRLLSRTENKFRFRRRKPEDQQVQGPPGPV